MVNLDNIKKLSPEERIKKLKELVEKNNEEIEKKNKEIKEAEKLSKQAEKAQADEKLKEIIEVPELEEIDISTLFEKKEEENLETKTKDAPEKVPEEFDLGVYKITPEIPTKDLYKNVVNIYNQVKEQGSVSSNFAYQAAGVQYALNEKFENNAYDASEETIEQANNAKKMADKILSIYTGGVKRSDGI